MTQENKGSLQPQDKSPSDLDGLFQSINEEFIGRRNGLIPPTTERTEGIKPFLKEVYIKGFIWELIPAKIDNSLPNAMKVREDFEKKKAEKTVSCADTQEGAVIQDLTLEEVCKTAEDTYLEAQRDERRSNQTLDEVERLQQEIEYWRSVYDVTKAASELSRGQAPAVSGPPATIYLPAPTQQSQEARVNDEKEDIEHEFLNKLFPTIPTGADRDEVDRVIKSFSEIKNRIIDSETNSERIRIMEKITKEDLVRRAKELHEEQTQLAKVNEQDSFQQKANKDLAEKWNRAESILEAAAHEEDRPPFNQ